MSDNKLKNYINISDIDCFRKNRVNKLVSIGTSNSYVLSNNEIGDSYIYANISSPDSHRLNAAHITSAYLKINNTSYNFYKGYSYTYTGFLEINNQKPALIAYDFINRNSQNLQLYNISAQVKHLRDGNQELYFVNEKSETSYFFKENDNEHQINGSSITLNEIKECLVNNDNIKLDTYISYSYIGSDFIIYNDGESDMNMSTYVWNMIDGIDETAHTYITNDSTIINSYVKIVSDDSLKTMLLGNLGNINDYNYIKFEYDNSNINNNWAINDDKIYDDTGISYSNFYNISKSNINSSYSFNDIYNHPSYRNNESLHEFFVNIKGTSTPKNNEEYSLGDYNDSNYNTAKYVRRIGGLPFHIFSNPFTFDLTISLSRGLIFNVPNDYNSNDDIFESCSCNLSFLGGKYINFSIIYYVHINSGTQNVTITNNSVDINNLSCSDCFNSINVDASGSGESLNVQLNIPIDFTNLENNNEILNGFSFTVNFSSNNVDIKPTEATLSLPDTTVIYCDVNDYTVSSENHKIYYYEELLDYYYVESNINDIYVNIAASYDVTNTPGGH